MQIFVFFALFIAILAVIFALQNTAPTTVSFLFWQFQGSLALILLIALSVGALISFLASLPTLVKTQLTIRSHKKKIAELGTSLDTHRSRLEEAQKKLQAQEQSSLSEVKPPPQAEPPSNQMLP
jgi:uncharacterized integral membrane protein